MIKISELFEKYFEKGYKYSITKYFSNSGFWYDILIMRGVGGFKISMNMRTHCMIIFGTANGRGEKAILENMDKLPSEMQEYFLNICRKCNSCRGCIKGVLKNPLTVTVVQRGVKTELCTMFPRHDWERPDRRLIELMFEYHELQEI